MPPPCDLFWNGSHSLCGPALLVPGLGKCGTNALANYLALHPRVRLTNQSEVLFDPRDANATELVARHNPGVTPGSGLAWIVKHPGLENRHASVLARRLRRAYPSASVALALCDPVQRAFRFFIYFLEYELRRHGARVTFTRFAQVTLKRRRITAVERSLVSPSASHGRPNGFVRYNTTVEGLFSSVVALRTDCVRSAAARSLAAALRADGYSIPPNWLLEDAWDPAGHGVCDPIVAKDSRLDRWVEDWVDAGYVVNQSLGVVFMESWARDGEPMVRRLLRVMRLPEEEYPWGVAVARFSQRVYDSEARRRYFKKGAPDLDVSVPLMRRQCGALQDLLGERPPWCGGERQPGRSSRRRRAGSVRRPRPGGGVVTLSRSGGGAS